MPTKLTTQEFIDRARAVHGDKYGYSFSVYQSTHTKVMIHCPDHGMFEQSPANHLRGQGCPSCVGLKKHTNESFIEKAISIHNYIYDYSCVQYVNITIKVMIHCPEHGIFEQRPSDHLQGRGCPDCASNKKHNNELFIEKAREVHGDRYNYLLVDYKNKREKVVITCTEHGDFEQEVSNHLHGQGCPGCANHGFNRTKVGFLYVLRSDCGQYMKIGITHDPKKRNNKLKRDTPFQFKRIELIEGTGEQIVNLEKELLAEYQPAEFDNHFDGYTEWRLWDSNILYQIKQEKFKHGKN